MSFKVRALAAGLAAFLGSCAYIGTPPPPPREFRGLWIAAVRNIDWPSQPGLPVEEQQRELVAIFDRMVASHLNAALLHVRPTADALYPSSLEPWSEYLTGQMGLPPEPFYDPLAFAIEEAHRRGIELHAWLNPYRARRLSETTPAAASHVTMANPELVRTYGSFLWMDPGEPMIRRRVVEVVRDLVRRYEVDGIHFDDYFYPYPENGADFPDEETWLRYGGGMSRADWRRKNVDDLIQEVARAVREERPSVQFGLSPFGIWRPGHPRSVRGLDAYEQIYADSRKWLREGWVDYFTPQLYWARAAPQQRFTDLLRWWKEQNVHDRHLWPGLGAHRVASGRPGAWRSDEIIAQIHEIRARRGAGGYILFNAKVLMQNRDGLADRLAEINRGPVPVPVSPWMMAGRR